MQPDRVALLLLLASMLCAGAAMAWRRTRMLAAAWVGVLFFVPVWAGVTIVIGWQPASAAGLVVLTLLTLDRRGRRLPVRWYDVGVVVFLGACLLASLATTSLEARTTPLTKWAIAYGVGRTLYSRVGGRRMNALLAVAASMAAGLATVEYMTSHNLFFDLPIGRGSRVYQVWAVEQERAGQWRAEGAFGHSIALGVCLAATVPAVIAAKFRPIVTVVMVAVLGVGIALTFSRLALTAAALAALMMLVHPRSGLGPRARVFGWVAFAASAVLAVNVLLPTLESAGTEASESAEYRARLWELTGSLDFFGTSPVATISPSGTLFFGSFRSIDNAVLLMALTYGILPTLLFLGLAAVAVTSYFRGFCSAPLVGLLALAPALTSVAFITQYEVYFFALVGMTCAATAERTRVTRGARAPVRRWAESTT